MGAAHLQVGAFPALLLLLRGCPAVRQAAVVLLLVTLILDDLQTLETAQLSTRLGTTCHQSRIRGLDNARPPECLWMSLVIGPRAEGGG